MDANTFKAEDYIIQEEPYYQAVRDEIEVFESAYKNQLPVLLKEHDVKSNKIINFFI